MARDGPFLLSGESLVLTRACLNCWISYLIGFLRRPSKLGHY